MLAVDANAVVYMHFLFKYFIKSKIEIKNHGQCSGDHQTGLTRQKQDQKTRMSKLGSEPQYHLRQYTALVMDCKCSTECILYKVPVVVCAYVMLAWLCEWVQVSEISMWVNLNEREFVMDSGSLSPQWLWLYAAGYSGSRSPEQTLVLLWHRIPIIIIFNFL